jgi:23S rRNA (uracil1939-C5)-methyltransferase
MLRVLCDHGEVCGGCPLITLPYSEQLTFKRGRVVQSVARYPSLELVYTEPVIPAEPVTEYRTRAKLIVGSSGKIGLFGRGGGHGIVDIPHCRVLSPALMKVASAVRARVMADETSGGLLTPFDVSDGGVLRAIDLREVREREDAAPAVLLTLVVQRSALAALDALREAGRALMKDEPSIIGVAVNFHEGDAPQILGSETTILCGVGSSPDRVGASTHLATFGSFVQAHRGQAAFIHRVLSETFAAKAPPRVLDLYGGSGAISLALAKAGAKVHLVESFAPAVAHARAAAETQRLSIETACGDVATTLRTFVQQKERFDGAVVNPPRRGVSAAARELLARLEPATIAYVSCDPDTLARDLDHLSRLGYVTTTLRPLDMIPLTEEVETIAILRRTAIARPRIAYEDEEILVVEKGPHEPTVAQVEYAGSLLDRVKRIPGAEEAVPVNRLDVGTSGLVVFARAPKFLSSWTAAFAAATTRRIFVVGVRGVAPTKGTITRELREDGAPVPARTRYRRLAVTSGHSVLRVIPEQGRALQIRRHLAAVGHPVLGDDRYGHPPTNRFFEEKHGLDRTFLHGVRLEIDHPTKGARLVVEGPLPGDLRGVLERTSGPGTLRFLDHKNALGTSSTSSMPPAPDSRHVRGSAIEESAAPSGREELTTDDDDRRSSNF